MAEDVRRSLETAARVVEQVAREAGIDVDEPLPQPPVALDAARARRAGLQVMRALAQQRVPADIASEALAEAAHETMELWSLLVAKAARVLSYTAQPDLDTWAVDAEPNLLLMQHVRNGLSRALEQLERELPEGSMPKEVRDGVDAFDRVLLPLFAGVSRGARRRIELLITHGVAPSPFCTSQPLAADKPPG